MCEISIEQADKQSFVGKRADLAETEVSAIEAIDSFVNHRKQAKQLGLVDLSLRQRTGFRGAAAFKYLLSQGLPVPAKPNEMEMSASGEMVLCLSSKEFWVLDFFGDQQTNSEVFSHTELPSSDCYSLFCQDTHAWFVMTGTHIAETMSKVCGVDLREESFPVGSIAQTSAARINVIIARHETAGVPCFSILCDSASAEYLWNCLLDAMQEFDGKEVSKLALA